MKGEKRMKKLLVLCVAGLMLLGMGTAANANTLKLALDADPVSLDPHVQLSGGCFNIPISCLIP
jgi:peptide/nickel transport system substrate-binding protein